ncbi:hypothetical protein HMF8227_00725 [Saliniradius amylolyticus]|uniref:Uncharacterized protein n=1 Tax=Saliniradius amylolyticus TaxID=2183582 RepID=A0A2S2E0P7_9ALTE|nr:hypothetical protein [Saliniradius amylolyticus]AWL11221.1 hypothetical protein HMF8227_00725 [Saliniradius amylolyticus]
MMKKIVAIGTSRIHWPLEYIKKYTRIDVDFLNVGYFQSAGQIYDLLFRSEEISQSEVIRPRFFRRDATPENPFNDKVFHDSLFIKSVIEKISSADYLYIELSTLHEFQYEGIHIQGNPNYYRNVPFSKIWKDGYYNIYEPELNVVRYQQSKKFINDLVQSVSKVYDSKLIFTSHIFSSDASFGREVIHKSVKDSCDMFGLTFIDKTPLVDSFGFRVSSSGERDIHHLSWRGTKAESILLSELILGYKDKDIEDNIKEDDFIEGFLL